MKNVKWGEYKLGELFDSTNGDFDIQKEHINGKGEYVITAGLTNNGILGRTNIKAKILKKGTITVDMFGFAFYRQFEYKIVTHARVFSLEPLFKITDNQGLFLASAFHFINKKFGYDNMCSWGKIQNIKIKLPIKSNENNKIDNIDFDFMETFIAELEAERAAKLSAYLKASGLDNYELLEEEKGVLHNFINNKLSFKGFRFDSIFNNIKQGRRLKKEDQQQGNIPFIMSGTTNTGVVGYISNPVASFPANSITVDIFGNTFYRNYDFGAGDDTGVYWNDKKIYSPKVMLYFAASVGKTLQGNFSYENNLGIPQSFDLKCN